MNTRWKSGNIMLPLWILLALKIRSGKILYDVAKCMEA